MPVRVTADSNIYISALLFGGKPLAFLELARAGKINLALSDPIREEVMRVLRDKFQWEEEALDRLGHDLDGFTRRIIYTPTLDVVKNDPDDNRIVECAIAAGSDFIVSGDNDLLSMGEVADIKIMNVADFLSRKQRGR